MASHGKPKVDQELQLKDIRRQLSDQLGCLEFRMESKLSLLSEFQEFFKRRGEVEYEYARSLERICEKFERNTKQRNIRNEVRSTFNLWSTLLAETRRMSRERASFAEVMASEMVARLEVMVKDVHGLTKRCKDICVEIQDQFLKELRDLSEQTKVYQHSCHNTSEAYVKVTRSKDKLDSIKGLSARRKKADEKFKERQMQHKVQRHLLLKNRNDYLLGISRCNALSTQYFSVDVMDIIEHMDFDYHDSFRRLAVAYQDSERETCEAIMQSGETLVEKTKALNFENDLHYFLSEYSGPFTSPSYFQFNPFEGDDMPTFKVNTEDVFKRWSKTMADLKDEIQTLQIQREEDIKTIQHIKQVNLKKYQVTTVEDALAVIEENGGDNSGLDSSKERGNASLERGLSLSTRGGQAIILSQKGKRDTINFTLQISQRRILRADRLAVANAQLDILERAFLDQKVPPVPVGVDSQGRTIPGEVPRLFGGEIVKYIQATGCEIPLIVQSCVNAIENCGMTMEGLFRVPGPAAVLEELRDAFEEGRDPLASYSKGKLDVAAVASTLKAYFRELAIPLFPTDKYQEFINCTRHDDQQGRLDALSATIHSLPPQVIAVMRFLFRFLYRVSLHDAENKMGTANIALVFGPTLTRAPDSLDPRQLHNDVPSVNILIQMCIEGHEYLFGDAEDTPVVSPAPAVVEQPLPPMSTSPPADPPTAPPTAPPSAPPTAPPTTSEALDSPTTSTQEVSFEPELCELPPPPCPPKPMAVPDDAPPPLCPPKPVELAPDNAPPPPRPPKPEAMSPPPPPIVEEEEVQSEFTSEVLEMEQQTDEPQADSRAPETTVKGCHGLEAVSSPQELESSTTSHTSGVDLSSLDAKMQEIEDSLQEMDLATPTSTVPPEEEEEDSDSEDEDEGDAGMRIGARALYDYEARSDKELTFNRGDALQVITKTPDNNWWDGFHASKRGFIPVAYVEITELKTSPSPPIDVSTSAPASSGTLLIPAPPQRKSSMPTTAEEASLKEPSQPTIEEEEEERPDTTPEPSDDKLETEPSTSPSAPQASTDNTEEDLKTLTDVSTPSTNFPVKSVRSLTKQFQEPEQVEQPFTHRRHDSDYKADAKDTSTCVSPPRSASGGSRVSMLSSNFAQKAAATTSGPPPPIRPRPLVHPVPTSPGGGAETGGVFPIMQHPGSVSVSPLQIAAHQSQHTKPPILGKKPVAQAKAPPKGKPSKVKKKDSLKEKDDKSSKPATTTKGFVATPEEIQAQIARAKRQAK